MKAIETKFHGPTNTRGSRITASDCDGNRVTVSTDYSLDSEANHRRAAVALCDKMRWNGAETMIAGSVKGGYVFVFLPIGLKNAVAAILSAKEYFQNGHRDGATMGLISSAMDNLDEAFK